MSSCTSPARFLASKILLVHRCFSPLWVPLIQIGVLVATLGRGNAGCPRRSQAGYFGRFFWCSPHSSSGYSTSTWWWTIQSFSRGCSRPDRADGGPDRAVFFLWVGAPQIQLNNRDVSTMSWAMFRIINRVVELQGPG